jgi:hypothetical protein
MPRLGIVADRYLYLSLSGILLLVSYQITGWLEKKVSCVFKIPVVFINSFL